MASLILTLGTVWRWVVRFRLWSICAQENWPGYQLDKGLRRTTTWLDAYVKVHVMVKIKVNLNVNNPLQKYTGPESFSSLSFLDFMTRHLILEGW